MSVDRERMESTVFPSGFPAEFDPALGEPVPSRPPAVRQDWLRALTSEEAEVVDALTAQLIAGAREAGVVRHIDRRLAESASSYPEPMAPLAVYRVGIALLQSHSRQSFGRPVQQLNEAEVEALLWDMLEGTMDGFDAFSPIEFFRMLRRHTAEGMERDIA